MSNPSIKGIIHGKTIELEREPGLPDGQEVSVEIHPVEEPPRWLDRLDVDPAVRLGKYVIKGTHLLVDDLIRLVEEGQSDEDLMRQFPELTPEDIDAVRRYALVPSGLRSAFGGWAEDGDELDEYLEW